MMREAWVSPETKVQQFMANEYVAACTGYEYSAYKFTCDARGGGYLRYYVDGVTKNAGGGYNACGATHISPKTDEYYPGFIDYNNDGVEQANERVIVWIDRSGRWPDYHCTTKLNTAEWPVARS